MTSDERPVASRAPDVEPEGPQSWLPVSRAVGGLSHLQLPADFAANLRGDLDEHLVTEVEDPWDR